MHEPRMFVLILAPESAIALLCAARLLYDNGATLTLGWRRQGGADFVTIIDPHEDARIAALVRGYQAAAEEVQA